LTARLLASKLATTASHPVKAVASRWGSQPPSQPRQWPASQSVGAGVQPRLTGVKAS